MIAGHRFCSPIASGWEFRTKFDDCYAWSCAPRLVVVFEHMYNHQIRLKIKAFQKLNVRKTHVSFQTQISMASLTSHNWGLEIPIHKQMQQNEYKIAYHSLLVLNEILYAYTHIDIYICIYVSIILPLLLIPAHPTGTLCRRIKTAWARGIHALGRRLGRRRSACGGSIKCQSSPSCSSHK